MEIDPPRGERQDNTLPSGELGKAFRAAQRGELRAAVTSGGSGPYYALIPLADLAFLETGAGTRGIRPTTVLDLPRKAGPRAPPAETAIAATLMRAGGIAVGSRVRVVLTKSEELLAAVVPLDDLARLEGASAEGAA